MTPDYNAETLRALAAAMPCLCAHRELRIRRSLSAHGNAQEPALPLETDQRLRNSLSASAERLLRAVCPELSGERRALCERLLQMIDLLNLSRCAPTEPPRL